MSDSTVGPRAEDAPSPEEPCTATDVALRRLKDTLQKGELRIPGTVEPRPTFGGVDPALAGTEYAGIRVYEVQNVPVDKVYLLDLEALPKFDIGKYHFNVVFTDALDNLCKPDPEGPPGLVDVGPPSPETFARDLEHFLNAPPIFRCEKCSGTSAHSPSGFAECRTCGAALDGFRWPDVARGPTPCCLCDATPCICGRAL